MTLDTARVNDARPDIRVVREPLTYEYGNKQSFFLDLARSKMGDPGAGWRLNRHRAEMDVELRTNLNTTTGTGGEFDPPLWAINKFSTPARAGRVLADLVQKLELPTGVSAVHDPKITTGATDAVQASNSAAVSRTDEVTADAGAAGNIVTITGETDASLQLLDQTPSPGYDGIVYVDLSRDYNQTLETQCLAGTGVNGQLTGVQNLTGRISDISGAGVSATQATGVPQFWPLLGQTAAALSNTRKLAAEVFLMAPRRFYWTAFLTVAIGTAQISPFPSLPGADDVAAPGNGNAYLAGGVPVYLDGAIPAGTNADVAMALRPSDMLLYESTPKFAVDMNPLSSTLQVRLQLRRYVAFVVMKPSSICVLTGLPAPTGY